MNTKEWEELDAAVLTQDQEDAREDRPRFAATIGLNENLAAAGLPLVRITTEDRLRGAIIEAVSELEQGRVGMAYETLTQALQIRPEPS